jgi:serine protease Do
MRRTILPALLAALIAVTLPGGVRAGDQLPSCGCGFANVLARVLPAVVSLSVVKVEAQTSNSGEASARRLRFFGSGFVIDPSGLIVTNRHVIQDAVEITVSFSDNTQAHATLLGAGAIVDLAVLKVTVGHKLPALKFADSTKLRMGDSVLAIGNPYGLGMSVSDGIVSALDRNISETPFDDDIQTNAAINPGNSGGPLVNVAGEVVGVDTALYTRKGGGNIGIGYAIPSNEVAFVVPHLLDPKLPLPGWIGVIGQDVTPGIAKAFGLQHYQGVILKQVAADGPASQAALRPGDIILTANGVAPANTRALIYSILQLVPGRKIPIAYWRNDAEQTAMVTVAAWPDLRALEAEVMASPAIAALAPSPDLGMGLATLTPQAREHYGLPPSLNGVLIALVSNNTEASARGLQPGDVITNIDGTPVSTPDEVQGMIEKASAEQRRYLGFLIASKSGLNWVSFYTGGKQPD